MADVTDTDLYHEMPATAETLWGRGFRPVAARDVEAGMVVAWVKTLLGFPLPTDDDGPLAGIHTGEVLMVVIDDDLVAVRHTGGETVADELDEVWARPRTEEAPDAS